MSHAVTPNYRIFAQTEGFNAIWILTRTLLAAGWRYKASGDATGAAKDTSGTFSNDRWGVGGSVNTTTVSGQTGVSPTIGAAASGISTITGLLGMSSTLSPGRFLQISGALNANNNGTFRIVAFVSATSVTIFNPGAVAETGTATVLWAEKEGGNTASISASGTGGAIPGRAIISGLTGMVSPTVSPLNRGSTGDRLTIIGAATGANNGTFLITRVISATSVEVDNASAVSDANNGSIHWVEVSPTAQTYAAHLQGATGQGAWINLQGPSTMKIPIGTNVPTGNFVRGENVTQTTTGAQGEILGVLTDTSGGLGYLVIHPRVSGTGAQATGPRGWNASANTDTITGATSGATVTTPVSSTPVEYVREAVWWKSTAGGGHSWIQCVDQSAESASRFSVLATAGAVTAVLAPGGPTGTFPAPGSWVINGAGGTNLVTTTAVNWFNVNYTGNWGNAHVMVANCIEGTGVSADGSWSLFLGTSGAGNSPSNGSYVGIGYQICDNSEDGDVDPYVTFVPMRTGAYNTASTTRTSNTDLNSNTSNSDIFHEDTYISAAGTFTPFWGFRRRGFSTGDAYQQFQGHGLVGENGGTIHNNPQNPCKIACHPNPNIYVKEPIWVISTQLNLKMRKGSLRWWAYVEGGVASQTYSNGTVVQMGTPGYQSGVAAAAMIAGPWDGSSTPSNA